MWRLELEETRGGEDECERGCGSTAGDLEHDAEVAGDEGDWMVDLVSRSWGLGNWENGRGEGRGLTEHGCEEDGGGEEDVSVHAESVVWEEILFDDLSGSRWVIELVW